VRPSSSASKPNARIDVLGKHLWKYAKEAEYRFNRRDCAVSMLLELISTFQPLTSKPD